MRGEADFPQDILTVAEGIVADMPSRFGAHTRTFAARVIARAILAERKKCTERVEAARQFVKRHPSLTLIDLAEFECFVALPGALDAALAERSKPTAAE